MFDKYLNKYPDAKGIINSLGIVFGDIGTSPIYTLTVIFLLLSVTEANVLGVLSLIIWTLIILVTIEYSWLAMSLSKKGEGGTIVLKEILVPLLKSGRKITFVTILSYIGISFLLGDGVITPAISILSAVEGIRFVPGYENIGQWFIILIACIIATCLFLLQKKGTQKIAWAFGPLMVLWFISLTVSGIISLIYYPHVLQAINPYYGISFLFNNGLAGFFVLSEVILCATGGEALYADMGHLGRTPILKAWRMVFIALVISYLGQGAFIISHPESKNILFEMISVHTSILYIPFLILSICATVIASQAMISGVFSVMYQAINTKISPMFKIDYTSDEMKSQIYIGVVNWALLLSVLFIILQFKESSSLAAAYGLSVTGTMAITGIMMTAIFYLKKETFKTIIALFVTIVDFTFLLSNMYKIPSGGYWSLIIASVVFIGIIAYTAGETKLHNAFQSMDLKTFINKYKSSYSVANKINGTALFFTNNIKKIPAYIPIVMFKNEIMYKDNVFITIKRTEEPFGVDVSFKERISNDLRVLEIKAGYMEIIDVVQILRNVGINEKIMFYGIENIKSDNLIWKIFSTIKKLSPSFVEFYDLPSDELHGVTIRIEM